jgi:N-carbamoyl-L-amino-acid hydrolase
MSASALPAVDHRRSDDRVWDQLMALAEHTEPGEPGWTRRVFSPAYRESRQVVSQFMKEAGLDLSRDAAGNLLGWLPGTNRGLPTLVIGSHTDTVAGGGRFDGMVGVIAAIEVARRLRESGTALRHSLWVVDFLGEEPNQFGLSCVGSRAVSGGLEGAHLALRGAAGESLESALRASGADPQQLERARWAPSALHAYIELHIEQSVRLEQAGLPLGVVTAIAGIHRARIEIQGRPDHAGATPMGSRQDALQAAAQVIIGIDLIGRRQGESEGVATVGRILVEPNSVNVVPALATLTAELRSTDEDWLREGVQAVERMVGEVSAASGCPATVSWISAEAPVRCDPRMRELLAKAVREAGAEPMAVPSGAGHDAAHVARLCPMGMLFVPSRDGRSHCPEEWTDKEQVAKGTEALLRALVAVDRAEL